MVPNCNGLKYHEEISKDVLWDHILYGCAKTTEAVRIAIKNSQESLMALAKKYAINPKTVAKWKKRETAHDLPMGPKSPHSTVLNLEEEAACVAFRKHTLLPLDDCLYALQSSIPKLTRSNLYRVFKRHGINTLPKEEGEKQAKKKFNAYSIGYFHIDITEVRTEEGKLYLFVAIDRTSKFVYVELLEKYGKAEAAQISKKSYPKAALQNSYHSNRQWYSIYQPNGR